MANRTIPAAPRAPNVTLRAVPSKSDSHRALIVAALADGESEIVGPLEADDLDRTADGLVALGIDCERPGERVRVRGGGGRIPGGGTLDFAESGTTCRLLTAIAALGARPSRLDGAPRLRERPLAPLVEALRGLGAAVTPPPDGAALPLVTGGRSFPGGRVEVDATISSQFASALLLIAPVLEGGLTVRLSRGAVSRPYVEMTVRTLTEFGVDVEASAPDVFRVRPGAPAARRYVVEGDHSTASYPLAAAALLAGRVRIEGLRADSLQGDRRLGSLLEQLGCRVRIEPDAVEVEGVGEWDGFDVDLSDAPDLAPTVAVLALAARGVSRIRGVAHLRVKESDRLTLLCRNIREMGRTATAAADRLEIGGTPEEVRGTAIETASDHRMAMAFAIAGLRFPGVRVDDDACVSKSNPAFWEQLDALCGSGVGPQN